jgi:uncharacterized protein (DUF58 family)
MSRLLIAGLLTYTLVLAGLGSFNNGPIVLAIPLIIYLATVLLFSPAPVDLKVERQVFPQRVSPGSPVEIELTIVNKGHTQEQLLIEDKLPPNLEIILGVTSMLTELSPGEAKVLSYQVRGARGIHYFEGIQTKASDRFGLFQRSQIFSAQGTIFIMPHVPKVKRVAIRPRQTRVYSGSVPARLGGHGVEFFGVRNFHLGDPLQRINWKVSARFQESLFINEYQQERVADVGLILDARQRCNIHTTQGSLFEHLITATAAISDTLIKDGNRVGLLVYGGFLDWTFPRYGKIQRERIFQALARAQPGDSLVFEKLENIPTKVFPKHSQLILFSPLLEEDIPILIHLRAQGYQVMVVSPDPVSFQASSVPNSVKKSLAVRLTQIERKLLLNQLSHAGVLILNWDVSQPFDQAMQIALARLPRLSRAVGVRR